jgi:uncharacterized membrane protein
MTPDAHEAGKDPAGDAGGGGRAERGAIRSDEGEGEARIRMTPGDYPGLPRSRFCPVNLALAIGIGFFVALVFVSPYLVPEGTVDLGDEGTTLAGEFSEAFEDMNPVARWTYDLGDATCHQHSDRSYFLNGNQMPFCARCVAVHVGMLAGILFAVFRKVELQAWWILAGFAPMAIDGGTQTILQMRESTNLIRVLTGFPAGFVTMLALGWVVWDLYDDLRYRRWWKKNWKEAWESHQEALGSRKPPGGGGGGDGAEPGSDKGGGGDGPGGTRGGHEGGVGGEGRDGGDSRDGGDGGDSSRRGDR